MGLGGGTFITQNKKLPGAYVNTVSAAAASASSSDRGVAAIGLELDWGEENKVIELVNSDFVKNSLVLFGYNSTSDSLKGLRDVFKHARKVLVYRLNGGGAKASNAFGTAKYSGTRGNDIKIVVSADVDNSEKFVVNTYLGTSIVDSQTVASASELIDNDFVVFKKDAALAENAGESMSGGANGVELTHESFLVKLEQYTFNAVGVVSKDSAVNKLYSEFGKIMRNDYGIKFSVVAYGFAADFEGTINAKNCPEAVYWDLGVAAGIAVNKSALNMVYDGEFDIPADYTQAQLEEAIENGEFVLHKVGDELRVLADINSLVTVTEEKGEIFKSNQTVRVADQIATDSAAVFNNKYLGKVQNDDAGRESFWGDIRSILKSLSNARAIEDFDDTEITVEAGNKKGSIVFSCAAAVIGTMEKLYMTCVIS